MPTEESEANVKTKPRFEEVFRSYADLTSEGKKSKKKSRPLPEQIELESLKNRLDFFKETENDVVLNKIVYDPEEKNSLRTKKKPKAAFSMPDVIQHNVSEEENKQIKPTKKKKKAVLDDQTQSGESMIETVSENVESENGKGQTVSSKTEIQKAVPVSKGFRKKPRSVFNDGHYENDLEEDKQQLIQAYQLQVSEEEAKELRAKIKKKMMLQMDEFKEQPDDQDVLFKNETGRKKKKKKVVEVPDAETSVMSISELNAIPSEESKIKKKGPLRGILAEDSDKISVPNMENGREEEEIYQKKTKVKKTKNKAKNVSESNPVVIAENAMENEMYSKRLIYENLVLGIFIHRTDKLKNDMIVLHPTVKIHVIDEKTGLHVKQDNGGDAVSSFIEGEKVKHILPVMTRPYDFKQFKTALPQWEEQIVFNERLGYLLQENEDSPKVILFFELLDVLSVDDARPNSDVQFHERGFRRIAWAFLKLVGANGVLNVDGKLRLQLYYPPSRTRTHQSGVDVFEWWLKYPRIRYPSTLYVTVKGLKLPDQGGCHSQSTTTVQQDQGASFGGLPSATSEFDSDEKKMDIVKWMRFPGQACRIPNKHLFSLRAGQQGCFSIRFSHDGRTLAAACADREEYPVFLYEIPSGQYLQELHGHLNIVYDICWSTDNQNLLTASSDGTARMWKIEAHSTSALKVFPHPAFVYTAKYHPVAEYLVVTGCYDSVVRIWNVMAKEIHGQLLQELDGHKSFINTLCFDDKGIHMFSGDSSGLVIVWNTFVSGSSKKNPVQHWSIKQEIRENDLKGISVNHLEVHPNGRRLLIHAKDSTLRVMDLRILATKKYVGATNYREKIHSALTPCGTFLFSGSEDGMAYVWNTETGDQVAKYSDLSYTSPLRDVAFHPLEHMVAFCAFGQSQPILVYIYDHKVSQLEAETIKDLNGSFISSALRRSTMMSDTDANTTMHDQVTSKADQFVNTVRTSMRLQKVKQKLDSVMTGSSHALPAPSLLSPHSKMRLPGSLATQLIPAQSLTTQNGSFSPVGHPIGRSPSFKLQMHGNESSTTSLKIEADNFMPVQETVVALYDYTAHRSDELTMHRGDIIQVLYKDNDSWWFGGLATGQQGYFPANYVAGETDYEEPDYTTLTSTEQNEVDEASPTPQRMSTAITKSREHTFFPHSDVEAGSPLVYAPNRKVKKTQRVEWAASRPDGEPLGPQEPSSTASPVESGSGVRKEAPFKKKKRKTPKNDATAGSTNNAFEPDSYHGNE
ncbi:jouberin isoform X2 [Lissotriton helveticus]